MAQILLAISLLVLAGCSSDGGKLPDPLHVWADMDITEPLDFPAPLRLPPSVTPAVGAIDGQDVVFYTLSQAEFLELRLEALNANSAIAFNAVPAANQMDNSVRALIEAGRQTEIRANWLAEREHEAREELYREKREHMLDNLLHRLLFIAGLVFVF